MPDIDAKKIEELLPCPFCGGDAHLVIEDEFSRFRCGQCGATGAPAEYGREYDATAAWNRRASHSLASASGREDAELCGRLDAYRDALVSPEPRDIGLNIGPNMIACRLDEAASSIRSLSAQLAEARRERAIERKSADDNALEVNAAEARATASESKAAELRERVGVLEKALKPFADRASRYDPDDCDDKESDWSTAAPSIRIGDLRRARTALEDRE